MKTSQLFTHCFTCLLIIMPVAASAQPYVVSTVAPEVTDQKTGLIWRRCVEGMSWAAETSTCTGTAAAYTYDQALAQAITASIATGITWRLPNIKELASIADKSRRNPAIDATVFPATPSNLFWSSSPYVGDPALTWSVSFSDGYVNHPFRTSSNYVRLVRAGQ
jgi:hypothetical protein